MHDICFFNKMAWESTHVQTSILKAENQFKFPNTCLFLSHFKRAIFIMFTTTAIHHSHVEDSCTRKFESNILKYIRCILKYF